MSHQGEVQLSICPVSDASRRAASRFVAGGEESAVRIGIIVCGRQSSEPARLLAPAAAHWSPRGTSPRGATLGARGTEASRPGTVPPVSENDLVGRKLRSCQNASQGRQRVKRVLRNEQMIVA